MVVNVGVMGIPRDKEHRMNEFKNRLEKFGSGVGTRLSGITAKNRS